MMSTCIRKNPRFLLLFLSTFLFLSCFSNNPYRGNNNQEDVYYSTFDEEPKHLDPARSYSSDEYTFLFQIYEPPVQYHFLKRPAELEPLTCTTVPEPVYYDENGNKLPRDAPSKNVHRAVYTIRLQEGIKYQNHPCFAKNGDGSYRYHLERDGSFPEINHPNKLPEKGTRELTAEDYTYQIKRLANPMNQCPIFSLLSKYIVGFSDFRKKMETEISQIRQRRKKKIGAFYNREENEEQYPIHLDMRDYDLEGLEVVDRHTYRISLKQKYPQFVYWLAMPFFAPIPWEAPRFYQQHAAAEQNLTLDRFPVGTGAFKLSMNVPNYRMVLDKNQNFHHETYPKEGEPEDRERGWLKDAGKELPFVEKAIYVYEKEAIPRWNKFLQGYYDASAIASDVYDQAIQMQGDGSPELSETMQKKNIRLSTSVEPSTYYYAFNMVDDVVGGYTEKKQKLRQAISIAVDLEEYIQIFTNGRGIPAHSPIPPGIFGNLKGENGIDSYVYNWNEKRDSAERKSIKTAKKLLAEAGYPGGKDSDGNQLVISYDAIGAGAGTSAYYNWMRKQFEKLGIQLQIRATDYNRFREKVRKGNFQIIRWGWNADYPDPENFLFLLYGPNSKVKTGGENAANYDNPEFNRLFKQMETMPNTPERKEIIKNMMRIARKDSPWIWGFHPKSYILYHQWYKNTKVLSVGGNTLKYRRIESDLRTRMREKWNDPITWPIWGLLGIFVLLSAPAIITVYLREQEKGIKR